MTMVMRSSSGGVRFDIRVTPRASRARLDGVRDGRLVVKVTAPPVDHAANEAVVGLLAEVLGVPRRQIVITHGDHGRSKTVEVSGLAPEQVSRRLSAFGGPDA